MRAFAIRSRIKPPHMGLVSQLVIVLLVVALMVAMAIEPVRQLLEQRQLVTGMKQDLREVEQSNESLRDRIARLNDPDFIEQRARAQIGLVREGEIPFVVMPSGKGSKAKDAKREKAKERKQQEPAPATAPTEDPGFFEGVFDLVGL
jgi:cell division protein DivIC